MGGYGRVARERSTKLLTAPYTWDIALAHFYTQLSYPNKILHEVLKVFGVSAVGDMYLPALSGANFAAWSICV